MNRRRFLQMTASGLFLPTLSSAGLPMMSGPRRHVASGGDLLDLPLLEESQITYLGQIQLPDPYDGYDMLGGGYGLGLGPSGELIAGTGQQTERLARFSIPSIGGTCTGITSMTTIPGTFVSGTESMAGSLYHAPSGRILYQKYNQYAADTPSGVIASCDTDFANHTTPQAVSPIDIPMRGATGYLGRVPDEWQSLVGGDCFMGGGPQSINSNTGCGPAFFAFNGADVDGSGAVPITTLLAYSAGDQPSSEWLFFETHSVNGGAIIPGTRTMLYFGSQGTGPVEYLQPATVEDDPCGQSSGFHAYPYQFCFWAFDMRDLIDVKNGVQTRYQPRPYSGSVNGNGTYVTWAAPGSPGAAGCNQSQYMSGFFDPSTMRVYTNWRWSRDIAVFQIS